MRILIAEDDPYSRRLLQRRLEKWGHEVVAAEDGTKAWETFKQGNFPIVLSDWIMPGMDGVDLIKLIRDNRQNSYIYTILLTAKDRKEDLIQGMESGADDFLSKPVDMEELKVRLRAGERIVKLEHRLAERNQELELANDRMSKSLDAAAKIQKSLLPSKPPEVPGVKFGWHFNPCDELAGDIFNVFRLNNRHVGLYVLDVSGHGVPAALLSVTLSRMLTPNPAQSDLLLKKNSRAGHYEPVSPLEVANRLNKRFPIDQDTGQFFTMLYGILDLETHMFKYVTAAHPGMVYLTRNGDSKIIEVPSLPMGMGEELPYEENILQLSPGDRIFLYSDGVSEARSKTDELFGKDRLLKALKGYGELPLQEGIDAFIVDVSAWNGNSHFDDDVTVLALEISE